LSEKANKYYFSTRDLVTIAVLGSLGAVFSVYLGYLITEAYNLIRVWFPVGESLSGIHLIWIVLVLGLTNKKGSGVLAGALKGFVEFILGSRLGIFVVLLSLFEGLFAEIGFWPFRKYRKVSYLLAGGLGTMANVILFQFYVPYASMALLALASLMSFISGVVLSGVLGLGIMDSLEEAGIIRREAAKKEGLRLSVTKVAAVLIALALLIVIGSAVFMAPKDSSPTPAASTPVPQASSDLAFQVTGSVNTPKEYVYYEYKDHFKETEAHVIGSSHDSKNYTGLPLRYVLEDAGVQPGATRVDILASDGYYSTFDLAKLMDNDDVLIVDIGGGQLKIISKDYGQEYWVNMITNIKVY
jgi:ABC-type thiamin/hydroxymethylpyrimidine transport system permease subunit